MTAKEDEIRDSLDSMRKRMARPFQDQVIDPSTGVLRVSPSDAVTQKRIEEAETREEIDQAPSKGRGAWKLVARRGQDFLWDIGGGKGIVTSRSRIVSETPLPLDSILARGYWDMVDGSASKI